MMKSDEIRSLLYKAYVVKEDLERLKKIEVARRFCTYLDQNDIYYDICIKHSEVLRCSESSKYYQRFSDYLGDDYSICKNLLVHEKKGDKNTYLIITDSNKQVDLSSVREVLECRKLEFVKEEEMKELIHATPGNVSLFSLIYDQESKVKLVIDEDLLTKSSLAFHPLYNGMSLFLDPQECLKFTRLIQKEVEVIPIARKNVKVAQLSN